MPVRIQLIIIDSIGTPKSSSPTLSTMINQFKGYVSKQSGFLVWQKGYYEEIIRNDKDYQKIWEHIDVNYLKRLDNEY